MTAYDQEVHAWASAYAERHSIAALAVRTGIYKRAALSLYINCKYPAKVDAIEAVLRKLMESHSCPYLKREITADDCRRRAAQRRPHQTGGEIEAHWLACQSCRHNNTGAKL